MMGVNWERLSLSGYFEALEAYNEAHDPDRANARPPIDLERLRQFERAHGVG